MSVKRNQPVLGKKDLERMAERHQFIFDLVVMKHRAGQLGLFRTLHAIDTATREVGYEMADLITGKQHT